MNDAPEIISQKIPLELFQVRLAQLNAIVVKYTPHPVLRYGMYILPFLMVGPILVFAHAGLGSVSSFVSVLLLVGMFIPIVLCPLYFNKQHWKCHEELCAAFEDFTRIDALPPRCMEWHLTYPSGSEQRSLIFPRPLEFIIEISFPTSNTSIVTTAAIRDLTPIPSIPTVPPPPYTPPSPKQLPMPNEATLVPKPPSLMAHDSGAALTSIPGSNVTDL